MARQKTVTVEMQPGEYFLGDPIYALKVSVARRLREEIQGPNKFDIDGHDYLEFRTPCRKGTYEGSDGFEYMVDSATIGLVPVALADQNKRLELVKAVKFDEPFTCKADYNRNVLSFGNTETDVG